MQPERMIRQPRSSMLLIKALLSAPRGRNVKSPCLAMESTAGNYHKKRDDRTSLRIGEEVLQ